MPILTCHLLTCYTIGWTAPLWLAQLLWRQGRTSSVLAPPKASLGQYDWSCSLLNYPSIMISKMKKQIQPPWCTFWQSVEQNTVMIFTGKLPFKLFGNCSWPRIALVGLLMRRCQDSREYILSRKRTRLPGHFLVHWKLLISKFSVV